MKIVSAETFPIDIWMAGDIEQAKQVCRRFCMDEGFCVHVIPADYIYTGGQETGFKVGVINYPRFPSSPSVLFAKTAKLANLLMQQLCQQSYTIVCPDKTTWVSIRKEDT